MARSWAGQQAEARIDSAILNRMIQVGKPEAMRTGIRESLTSDRFMHQTTHGLFLLDTFNRGCYPIPRHRQKDFAVSGASFV